MLEPATAKQKRLLRSLHKQLGLQMSREVYTGLNKRQAAVKIERLMMARDRSLA